MSLSYSQQESRCFELIRKQQELEAVFDAEYTAVQLRKLTEEAAKGSPDAPKARRLAAVMFNDVAAAIDEHKQKTARGRAGVYRSWLRQVDTDVAALIAIRTTIARIYAPARVGRANRNGETFQDLARAIGRAYITEAKIAQAREVNPLYIKRVEEYLDERLVTSEQHRRAVFNRAFSKVMMGELDVDYSNSDLIHLGKFGLDACVAAGLLLPNQETPYSMFSYTMSDEVHEYLMTYGKGRDSYFIDPVHAFMLCPPDEWTTLRDGGYLTPRRKSSAPLLSTSGMTDSTRKRINEAFTAEKMPAVFRCANYLQGVAYTIHQPTLDMVRAVWRTGGGAMGVPERSMRPKPDFPFNDEWNAAEASPAELHIFTNWKRMMQQWYFDQRVLQSKQLLLSSLLRTKQSEHDAIWYTTFMDDRGRWYYRGNPNPQSMDIARACIHFKQKKPLGEVGLRWLKIHIANSLGVDDIRMDQRAAYVDAHWERLEAALDNPLDNLDIWGDENPMTAYSAAYELREAYRSGNPLAYKTGIPIHIDATVSGTQHFSAMLRDPVGARYTNLIDIGGDRKADLYTAVAEATLESIKMDLNGPNHEYAEFWLNKGVSRDLAKRPVMTFVYGVTLLTTADYVSDWLFEHHREEAMQLDNQYSMYLGRRLFEGIANALPATVKGMQFLQSLVRAVGRDNTVHWRTPSGMYVIHEYRAYKERRVHVATAGVTRVVVRDDLDHMNIRSSVDAISPNFVHSMDAAHLTLVANRMNDLGLQFSGIHDSFGSHPCDMDTLARITREEFVNMYEESPLLKLMEMNPIPENKKDSVIIPEFGTFDLNNVLNSEFFFS